ncbi:MAG: hypothetical protein IT453_07535 [Planctomycetes bacterium]|nr:hypothetical protein [Planctomycetota bacterium]
MPPIHCYRIQRTDEWDGGQTLRELLDGARRALAPHAFATVESELLALERVGPDVFRSMGWDGSSSAEPFLICIRHDKVATRFAYVVTPSTGDAMFVASHERPTVVEELAVSPPVIVDD